MVNLAQILGRIGKIETKTTPSGVKVCNASMVTSKKFTKNGEKQEKTTWHNVVFFSKLAEIAEKYVSVGDLLYIKGEIDNQKYTTKEGQERIKSCVIVDDLQLMPKQKEHKPAPKDDAYQHSITDDEIPW